MKKFLIFILAITAVSLTSCLKDKPNTDFSLIKGQAVVELPWSGLQYFGKDAITATNDTIVMKFGVNIASASPLSTSTNYTLAVDYALMNAYVSANPNIDYLQMPAGTYTISKTSGTIAAGKRLDSVTVTIYKNKLDPTQSYMLPVKLASASNGILSGNFNAHYYHIIGNDFAGTYLWDFTRTPPSGNFVGGSATGLPLDPNTVQFPDHYYTGLVTFLFTFTKTGNGPTAQYTNLAVNLDPATVASQLTPNGISVSQPATFVANPALGVPAGQSTLAGPYTHDQVKQLLDFTYQVFNGSANRTMVDRFY
jgi:hypothetical protein